MIMMTVITLQYFLVPLFRLFSLVFLIPDLHNSDFFRLFAFSHTLFTYILPSGGAFLFCYAFLPCLILGVIEFLALTMCTCMSCPSFPYIGHGGVLDETSSLTFFGISGHYHTPHRLPRTYLFSPVLSLHSYSFTSSHRVLSTAHRLTDTIPDALIIQQLVKERMGSIVRVT